MLASSTGDAEGNLLDHCSESDPCRLAITLSSRHAGRRVWVLPLGLGFSDGILNALILASGAFLHGHSRITVMLALRIGCVALITALFTMFVARYAEERSHLSDATRQLNLSNNGHLAATGLRRLVRGRAMVSAIIASASSFVGATVPMAVGGLFQSAPWVGLFTALVLLGLLGGLLAVSFEGRWKYWVGGLVGAGAVVAVVGSWLNIA